MPDLSTADAATAASVTPILGSKPPDEPTYTMSFEPFGAFDETELFLNGRVRGRIWISSAMSAIFRSLTGREIDAINSAVRIKDGMSLAEYNTAITYYNLAYALEKLGDREPPSAIESRLDWLKDLAAPLLGRLHLAYLEFSDHVADIYRKAQGTHPAKKS